MKELNNTYWNQEGKYQDWYNTLKKQIPAEGKAEKGHIDLVRCAANLYYDHFNNGGGNWEVRRPEFWYIVYNDEELQATAKAEGVESIWRFLNEIAGKMERAERLLEDNEPGARKLIDSLDSKWEILCNTVIRYAWEVEAK